MTFLGRSRSVEKKTWRYGAAMVFSLLWSSAFIAGKVALTDFGPLTVLSLRFLLSAAILLPFCLNAPSAAFSRTAAANGFLLGILNNVFYLGLTFTALRFISPSLVIVIVSCAPFITTALSAASGLEKIRPLQVLGIAVGFAGVVVVSGVQGLSADDSAGILAATLGTIAFSVGTVFFGGRSKGLRIRDLNFWQSVAGAAALTPAALFFEPVSTPPSVPTGISIAYLAIAATIGGMAFWFWLIRTNGPAVASSCHLMNPLFGMLLSWAILDGPITPRGIVGVLVVGLGLSMVIYAKRKAELCVRADDI